jgi:DNA-binding response OmpR family regulator
MGYARDELPEEKIVDVFVCKIRKKFRAVAPVGQYIESVPGSGYRVYKAPALLSVA